MGKTGIEIGSLAADSFHGSEEKPQSGIHLGGFREYGSKVGYVRAYAAVGDRECPLPENNWVELLTRLEEALSAPSRALRGYF